MSNALRHGWRALLRDPVLLLIELAWRWTFGIVAACICALSAFVLLGRITVDVRALEGWSAISPLDLIRTLASSIGTLGVALVRVGILGGISMAICWTVLSALGRYATLRRPALAPGTDLKTCFAISAMRALTTVLCIVLWTLATLLAGMMAAVSARGPLPNTWVIAAILVPTSVVLVVVWSVSNWYMSLAPIFPERTFVGSTATAARFTKLQANNIFEVSMAVTLIRAVLLPGVVMLSVAVGAVISNVRVLMADLLAISLLYFFCADFLYVVRLAAYADLRSLSAADLRRAEGTARMQTETIPEIS